ncbi:hypothetical protein IU397_05340 [Actibacterium sp. 188UL27-1]|nr:hypothetical protein [Actibacterium sp. 188UL27-1]
MLVEICSEMKIIDKDSQVLPTPRFFKGLFQLRKAGLRPVINPVMQTCALSP